MSDVGGYTAESAAWTAETEVSANDVLQKQALIKEILTLQDSLRSLASRASSVETDCGKAEADNEMLQAYIDSVTKSLAAKGAGGGGGGGGSSSSGGAAGGMATGSTGTS